MRRNSVRLQVDRSNREQYGGGTCGCDELDGEERFLVLLKDRGIFVSKVIAVLAPRLRLEFEINRNGDAEIGAVDLDQRIVG